MRLFHVSEEAGIERFVPRPPSSSDAGVCDPVVWAVDESRLHNYLLPRDCPRVTFYAGAGARDEDVRALLGPDVPRAVVAIESAWLERVRATKLFLYELPGETFTVADRNAGYWVSRVGVVPLGVSSVDDCLAAIATRDVEIRIVSSLWRLRDAVVASSLSYSCIRMRTASPRPSSPQTI